jgi:hypothetical protein
MPSPKPARPAAANTAVATPKAPVPSLERRIAFEDFLALLSAKDRQNAEKHLLAVEALADGARHAALWRRLTAAMATLAPHAAKLGPQNSVLFFVPDGPYKMQVLALHDPRDGTVTVYCDDVIDDAVRRSVLRARPASPGAPAPVNPRAKTYTIAGVDDVLVVEPFDASVNNLPAYSRNLVGWSRKAISVALPATATEPQVAAVEQLLELTFAKLAAKS